jgi:Fe-S-cluster-containing hydrogenase component 2
MKKNRSETGILSDEDLDAIPGVPSKEFLVKGPIAIIKCAEEIPCNPCVDACPKGAIRIEGNINALPVLLAEKCTGCGLCIPSCPGLAIFIVDMTYSEEEAIVKLPYEFLPLPQKGDTVIVMDREGKDIGKGKIHSVLSQRSFDRTPIVSVRVPKRIAMEVNHFRPTKGKKYNFINHR